VDAELAKEIARTGAVQPLIKWKLKWTEPTGILKQWQNFDKRAENSETCAQASEMKPEVISSTCWYGCWRTG